MFGRLGLKPRVSGNGHNQLPDGREVRLALYMTERCPYCWVVFRAAERLGVNFEYRNILADSTHLSDLVTLTGRRTVPCMLIDNKPMFESSQIVAWLDENFLGS